MILIYNSYKTSQYNSLLQERASRSQFLSRITLKASSSVNMSKGFLSEYLHSKDIEKLYQAEDNFLGGFSTYHILLSNQQLQNSDSHSEIFRPRFEEILLQFEELLQDEKQLPKKRDLILTMIDSTDRLAYDLLNEESGIWFKESQSLRDYAKLKDSTTYLFYSLTIGFIIAQALMSYNSILKSRLIKKINLQNEHIIQQTRLSTVGLMSAELAHEINSPLMVIDGRLKIIEAANNASPPQPDKIARNLDIIKRNSNRIHSIIKSFKTMVNDGQNDNFEFFSINNLFEDVKEIVQARAYIKKVNLNFNIYSDAPKIYANKVQIVQTVTNLVSNSIDEIKNLDEKWIGVDYQVDEENACIRILVTDSGLGISEELQSKIFLSFYSTKNSAEGTGLGLSISKKIANEHGGDLYYNPQSINTQFILVLPYKKAQS